jgi:hypothetical protein
MFLHVYDSSNQLLVALVPRGLVVPSVYEEVEAIHARMAEDARRSGRPAVILLIVESADRPDAATRQRLAASESRIPHLLFFLVAHSSIARLVLLAVDWLRRGTPARAVRSTHKSYEQARDRLAQVTGMSAEYIDSMYRALRELERRRLQPPLPPPPVPAASAQAGQSRMQDE